MLHIHIVCLGRLKESYWQDAEAEYLKRLGPYAKISFTELKEEPFGEKDPPETIKAREALKINASVDTLKAKVSSLYIVVLDSRGKTLTSTELAGHLHQNISPQSNDIAIIIGGPLGLDPSIPKRANLLLSLSALTFTHQMVRIILLEQLYRAMMIASGRKYHY